MDIPKSRLRLLIRLCLVALWIFCLGTVFVLARALNFKEHQKIIPFFHRGLRWILGLSVNYVGEMSSKKPTLFVANHVSYFDVFVLGCLPSYFIAKSDIANWPIIGWLASLQNTLFIERKSGRAKYQMEVMQEHLLKGSSLTLFPEGTSTEGVHVEPFKSSLFEAVNLNGEVTVAIQPITISYTHLNGQLMEQSARDNYAWYADMAFGSHILNAMKIKKATINVCFHSVCYLEQFANRKECADYCQRTVADHLNDTILEAPQVERS